MPKRVQFCEKYLTLKKQSGVRLNTQTHTRPLIYVCRSILRYSTWGNINVPKQKLYLGHAETSFFRKKPHIKNMIEPHVTKTIHCCNPLHPLATNINGNYSHTST